MKEEKGSTRSGADEAFQRAFARHRSGDRAGAEEGYRAILARTPGHARTTHFLGVLKHEGGEGKEAVALLRRAARLDPENAMYHSNLGVALDRIGMRDEAINAYRRALKIQPNFPDAHLNLGVSLLSRRRPREALACFRKAIELKPDYTDAYYNLGNLLKDLSRLEEAAGCYRKALSIDPNHGEARYNLGISLKTLGRLDAAQECFQEVLRKRPGYGKAIAAQTDALMRMGRFDEAYRMIQPLVARGARDPETLVAYAQMAGRFDYRTEAIGLLQTALGRGIQDPHQRRQILFLLGRLHDDMGDVDRAFDNYRRGNAMVRGAFNPRAYKNHIDRLMTVYRELRSQPPPVAGNRSTLPVFVVGMPRSGTTLVEQILSSHPEVHGAGELQDLGLMIQKMPAILGTNLAYPDCLDRLTQTVVDRLAGDYLKRLRTFSADASRVTDKMPQNFLHLGLIRQLFPAGRIIHCTRDPRDTGLSIYFQNFSDGLGYAFDLRTIGVFYRQYRRMMHFWKSVMAVPTLDVRYEELVSDPEAVSRRMIDFVGLDWDDRCLRFHETERSVVTSSFQQVREPIYKGSVGRWKRYKTYIRPLIETIDNSPCNMAETHVSQ